ncbi:VOC family protein [Paragemmobacter straminiformis]|uniref:VOC family protein n=1 Tax=Paragemmobacter straminiformis TaxID=2045119 RepID=A0A842I8N2_9RHOB|nr:VOC family protein [Gemmobacter straminiformis]MBC2835773.1 VOC family protein [Gemmobacter straminiformis]
MGSGIEIIPELRVRDIPAAEALLASVFGFAKGDGVMALGSQRIALVQGQGAIAHGGIDHLALAVTDLPATLAALQARGAALEETTPHGAGHISEFWEAGITYVFLRGPEGARIELCQRLPADTRAGLPGHDHIGIPCTDIAASQAFFESLGCALLSAVSLHRPEGVTEVRFLSAGASVVELYEPPALRGGKPAFAENGFWAGLRLVGTALDKGERSGPDGLRLTVL